MSAVFKQKITLKEQEFLFDKVDQYHTKNFYNCHIWKGEILGGYPNLRVTFRGKRVRFRVHRLIYYLSINAEPLDPDIHVSHLCHNKCCINLQHLSYEPNAINCQRNLCKIGKQCFGHKGYRKCIV